MSHNINLDFIKNHSLMKCLNEFDGAHSNDKENELNQVFCLLAQKMIYGGYIKVRKEYAIFISKVEFYYHEEEVVSGDRIIDDIVYHRDGRFVERDVPYFPIMTLHSHWSGFDITFEKESGHYRASALIRQYVVLDLNENKFVELNTSWNKEKASANKDKYNPVGIICLKEEPFIDTRSTYLQYFLNGFSMNGGESGVEWCEISNPEYHEPKIEARKNAPGHKWGFIYRDKKEYEAYVLRTKESIAEGNNDNPGL